MQISSSARRCLIVLLLCAMGLVAAIGAYEWRRSAAIARLEARGFRVQRYHSTIFWLVPSEHIFLHGAGDTLDDADVSLVASEVRAIGNVECVYLTDSNVTTNGARELWLKLGRNVRVQILLNDVWHVFLEDEGK